MKTIEEAANGYILENYLEQCTMRQYIKDSFESGVEFAQRWIPVTEELPSEERVLVKERDEYLTVARYDIESEEWVADNDWLVSENVTHWRPIEVK